MNTSHITTKISRRSDGLDVVRGINIVAMIVYHFILPYYPEQTTPFSNIIHFIGSLVAPLFFFLAGSGVKFSLEKYKPSKLFKRGLFLFIIAFLVSVFLKKRFYFDWSLIQDIGATFMIMAALSWLKQYKFLAAVCIYLVFFGLFVFVDFKINGIFPLYPMAIYFLFGYGFSQICPTTLPKSGLKLKALFLVSIVLILVVFGTIGLLLPNSRFDWYFSALLNGASLMLLYFIFVFLLSDHKFDGKINNFIIQLGRLSLTTYYIQQGLLVVLLKLKFHPIIITPIVSYVPTHGYSFYRYIYFN